MVGSAKGVFKVHGKVAGRDFVREVPVTLAVNESAHDALPALWARAKVADMECDDFRGHRTADKVASAEHLVFAVKVADAGFAFEAEKAFDAVHGRASKGRRHPAPGVGNGSLGAVRSKVLVIRKAILVSHPEVHR